MSSTRASRLLASPFIPRSLAPTNLKLRHCAAVSRCYATKPTPKATAAKLNSIKKKAASRKQLDVEENDSLAARTPFKKPSTEGLGVPSASPSSASTPQPPPRSSRTAPTEETDISPAEKHRVAEAERKEEVLRTARLSRMDRMKGEEDKGKGEREYGERRRKLKGRYMGFVVGTPFVVILSWELWERLAKGKEKREVIKDEPVLLVR